MKTPFIDYILESHIEPILCSQSSWGDVAELCYESIFKHPEMFIRQIALQYAIHDLISLCRNWVRSLPFMNLKYLLSCHIGRQSNDWVSGPRNHIVELPAYNFFSYPKRFRADPGLSGHILQWKRKLNHSIYYDKIGKNFLIWKSLYKKCNSQT